MTLLSVRGLYSWDNSIFNTLHLPDGIDRNVVIGSILTECAELEILLPDPDTFKESLNYWSLAQFPIWKKLYESTQLEYNPIWNKDGTITETRHLEKKENETRNNTETRDLESGAETTATGKTAGYNSAAFQNQDQTTTTGSGTDTGTVTNNGSANNTGEHDETITRRETGNIGVTTTQQMLREQREVVQFDIYKYIVEAFKSMYCLGVY